MSRYATASLCDARHVEDPVGKRTRRTAIVLVTSMLVGLASALSSASPAAATPQPFSLDLVEGELLIRDAEEPSSLGQPTTISGQHDTGDGGTGAITAGAFASPPISFVTEALGQQVFVDAAFSQVSPGSGTGSIDADGNVAFRTELTVDLHIEVNDPPDIIQECQATPVSIALDSVAPWDPETGEVTVRDADFTVPQVPTTDTCIGLVADNVNELLAGGGHSLTMTLEGDLTLPPPAGCPTTTALSVEPSSSFLGDDVTLEATVTPAPEDIPECADAEGVVPAGSVELRAGDDVVGVADLDGAGVATLVTDDLPSGDLSLTARYRGQPPYSASTSTAVAHTVAARPAISADVPSSFVIGADPTEFEVTVANSGLGSEVVNARLDFGLRRTDMTAPVTPDLTTIERFDGSDWVPAALEPGPFTYGSLMPATGVPLGVGESVTQRVRLAVTPGTEAMPVALTFELIPVDPGTGAPTPQLPPADVAVASATLTSVFTGETRRPTTLALGSLIPHTLQRGMVARAEVLIQSDPGGPNATGTYEVLFDGAAVPIRSQRTLPELGYQPTMSVRDANGLTFPKFIVPPTAAVGTHQVTIRYSGDAFYAPSQVTRPLSVVGDRGPTYECVNRNLFFADRFNVNIDAFALVPMASRPGTPRSLPLLDIQMYADRGDAPNTYGIFFGPTNPVLPPGSSDDGIRTLDLDFGALGSGTATEVTFANQAAMGDDTLPADPDPDMVSGFTGETASITLEGAPGDVVPVELESVTINAVLFGFAIDLTCTPLGDPAGLGDVIVAGTTLAVDGPEAPREGDDVTLRAQVEPKGLTGTVEFLDGDTTLAVVAVAADGTASFTTDDLAVGSHSLSAAFHTSSTHLSTTSAAVPLVVAEAALCPPSPMSAHGATVRLIYLTTLGRCPSASESSYWVGRLGAGASQASVARSIATGSEGVGVLVEAGYQRVLDRSADSAGKAYWVARLRAGYRYDRFLASLAASPEFYSAGGGDEGFVTRLYERVLERAPEADGLDYWVGRLDAGVPRWRVALSFTAVDEVRRRLATIAYQTVLDRAPTAGELTAASTQLRLDGDLAALYARLAGTQEFADRAQGLPNPVS